MKLPTELAQENEWALIGPMGPRLPWSLKHLPLLVVDGGANFCEEMDIWLGDGDSKNVVIKARHVFDFPSKKNSSDFALALTLFTPSCSLTLHCWGFLGGRRDHEIINFGEALTFLKDKLDCKVIFYDSVTADASVQCFGPGRWQLEHHGVFSVATHQQTKISITGSCAYKLLEMTELKPLSSLGLSNSASGAFELNCEGPVMLFFPEKL